MKAHKDQNEGVGTTLIGYMFAAPFLALFYAMLGLCFLLRKPLSRAFKLEEHCLFWPYLKWLLVPLQWSAALGFGWCVIRAAILLGSDPADTARRVSAALYLCTVLCCALIFNLIRWLQQLFQTPATQKKMAGLQAERRVKKLIESSRYRYPDAIALHGALFVFHPHTANEFSVEVDHLLVTRKNVFVIETKYKSGTISAAANAKEWPVRSAQGKGTMRNALSQAKNTARVIGQQAALPCPVIPVVAIHGSNLKIVDGPANVVAADALLAVIDAFDAAKPDPVFSPDEVIAQLNHYRSEDKAMRERHLARATLAQSRAKKADIAQAASL